MKPVNLLRLLLLVVALGIWRQSNATYISGANISYRAVDSVTYLVTARIYADCGGFPRPSVDTLSVSWQGGGFTALMNLQTTHDVTGTFNGCTIKSRCSGGTYNYGVKEHIYTALVNIAGSGCMVTFSWKGKSRSPSITTGPANTGVYIFAELNKCAGINNSAHITYAPQFLLPVGRDLHLNPGFIDTVDNDSLYFVMMGPMEDSASLVGYSGNFTAARPLTFLGFPNFNLSIPAGFHFENTTAQLAFRTTSINQVSVMVIEAREYRRINNTVYMVGRTRLEYSVIVTAALGELPKITHVTPTNYTACPGVPFCVTYEITDTDNTDTTFISCNNALKGAQFTVSRNGRKAIGKLCWTPTLADVRNWPHTIAIQASDNACAPNGVITRVAQITVLPAFDTSYLEIEKKEVVCNQLRVKMKKHATAKVKRHFTSPDGSVYMHTPDSARIYFANNGWNKFTVSAEVDGQCGGLFLDSVWVQMPYALQLNTRADSVVCPGDTFAVTTAAINGAAPHTFSWGPQFVKVKDFKNALQTDSQYRLVAEDAVGCVALDTINMGVHQLQKVTFITGNTICNNAAPVKLFAIPATGNWAGAGLALPDTFLPGPLIPGVYPLRYSLLDSNSCKVTDTLSMQVMPVSQPNFSADLPSGAPPLTVVFTPTFTPPADFWAWYITNERTKTTDTVIIFSPTITKVFNDTGKYTVTLMSVLGQCTAYITRNNYVNVSVLAPIGILSIYNRVIKIYPNPADGLINVSLENDEEIEMVKLTDMAGKQMLAVPRGGEIDITGVGSGMYIITVTTRQSNTYYSKIVVQ